MKVTSNIVNGLKLYDLFGLKAAFNTLHSAY